MPRTTRTWSTQHGPAYAIPAVFSWMILAAMVVGLVFFRATWAWFALAFFAYFTARVVVHTVFYIVGELRCQEWGKRDWMAAYNVRGVDDVAPADVHHVVLLPNYTEPAAVLRRTLDALAAQHAASERLVVVLGMEEREAGAAAKGEQLAAEYEEAFARILVSVHPRDIPGELACKASNMRWAAALARAELDAMGVDPARCTITAADADSVLHPSYFAAISELFARDERRYARFWQAPLFYYNNLWQIPAPVRFSAWFTHAGMLAELAMPGYDPLPISTYTMSMRLAEECDWWDPAVISEDWHVYLDYLVQRDGDLSVTPVYLPTMSDSVEGTTWLGSLKNRYDQLVRHCWGAEDVAFLAGQVASGRRSAPIVFRLGQVLHDHVMRVAAWAMVTSLYLVSGPFETTAIAIEPLVAVNASAIGPLVQGLFAVSALTLLTCIGIDLVRCPPRDRGVLRVAGEVAVMWVLLPVVGLIFGMLPALHAQTKLAFGLPLHWNVSPKRLHPRMRPSRRRAAGPGAAGGNVICEPAVASAYTNTQGPR